MGVGAGLVGLLALSAWAVGRPRKAPEPVLVPQSGLATTSPGTVLSAATATATARFAQQLDPPPAWALGTVDGTAQSGDEMPPTLPQKRGDVVPSDVALSDASLNQRLEQGCQAGKADQCLTLARRLLSVPPRGIARGRRMLD